MLIILYKMKIKSGDWMPKHDIEKSLRNRIKKKYYFGEVDYNKKMITEIMHNDKSQIVSRFRDYLIFNESDEYLTRFYKINDSIGTLYTLLDYYENNSRIFPNYIALSEAKYIYKNIQKKQKMIDLNQKIEEKQRHQRNKPSRLDYNRIFDTEAINSIMNQTNNNNINSNGNTFIPLVYDKKIGQTVQLFKCEDSLNQMERLIEAISQAEKTTEENRTEINTSHTNKSGKKLSINSKIFIDDTQLLDPLFKKEDSFNTSRHTLNEVHILNKKHQEILKKNHSSADITNNTAIKNKIKNIPNSENASTLNTANPATSNLSDKKSKIFNEQEILEELNREIRHKPTSSMPKLFNDDLLQTINQRNNLESIVTKREKIEKPAFRRGNSNSTQFDMTERNKIIKIKNLKPDFGSLFSKNNPNEMIVASTKRNFYPAQSKTNFASQNNQKKEPMKFKIKTIKGNLTERKSENNKNMLIQSGVASTKSPDSNTMRLSYKEAITKRNITNRFLSTGFNQAELTLKQPMFSPFKSPVKPIVHKFNSPSGKISIPVKISEKIIEKAAQDKVIKGIKIKGFKDAIQQATITGSNQGNTIPVRQFPYSDRLQKVKKKI